MEYDNSTSFRTSWYEVSSPIRAQTDGPLTDSTSADVCVIGGGFTGLSAALELAQNGYRVVLLEAARGMAAEASGKNGGHIQRGLAQPPGMLIDAFGFDATRTMCDMTFEGLDLIRARATAHDIPCDLRTGQLTAALTDRHLRELENEQTTWRRIGRDGFHLLDQRGCESYVRGEGYIGGLYDSLGGHFHPYAYAQGIAIAAQKSGARLHDDSRVCGIDVTGAKPVVMTHRGASVTASHVLIAGAIDIPPMRRTLRASIHATAHMIATAPLDEDAARALMPGDVAVADANFVMNYYRLSSDRRLLFGGNCNYSGRDLGFEHHELGKRLAKVFPSLSGIGIAHCWHGPLDLTANRLPAIGRLAPQVFYAHGFGGHGVAATNLMGKLTAEAIMGTAARFDVFAHIGHLPFPGGAVTKRPLFMLGMLWYRLRDALHA